MGADRAANRCLAWASSRFEPEHGAPAGGGVFRGCSASGHRYPALFQGSIRILAHDYGSMLLRQAKFMRDLIMTGLAPQSP